MTSTPNRRRLRFSIAALLILTAFCSVLLAWWQDRQRLTREVERVQRDAEWVVRRLSTQQSISSAQAAEVRALRHSLSQKFAEPQSGATTSQPGNAP